MRGRGAAGTREAILDAARDAFTKRGYDGAGVREIAANAKANVALVNRYFGSKAELFDEAVPATFSVAAWLGDDRKAFARAVARHVLEKGAGGEDGFDATLAMVRSAGNPEAAQRMRRGLEERFVAPLAEWIGGPDAEVRAALVAAVLAGAAVVGGVLRVGTLAGPDAGAVERLADLLDRLVGPGAN
jgi:AcrR family transcriptional regulator